MPISFLPVTQEHRDYLRDESHTVGTASHIFFPKTEAEVAQAMSAAWAADMPVTIQGARTGISAGCVPNGGLILSLTRMTAILGCRQLPDGRFSFRAQPGLALSEFCKAVEGKRCPTAGWDEASLAAWEQYLQAGPFLFTPDPTERSASLGGMAACNASGARTYLYGPTRPHVLALRAVLADGRTLALRRGECFARGHVLSLPLENGDVVDIPLPTYQMPNTKNTSGYYAAPDMDAIDLFLGSDGTLAVLTELELALTPTPPYIWGVTAFFPDEDKALDYVISVRDGSPKAAAIEYFDGDALDILRDQKANSAAFASLPQVPDGARAAVYVELHDQTEQAVLDRLLHLGELMTAAGGSEEDTLVARTDSDRAALQFFRHAIPESVNMLIAQRKRIDPIITKLGTDMAVPDEHLRRVMAYYRSQLSQAGLQSAVWGHIGNNHLHVNILPNSAAEYRQGKALYAKWAEEITRLHGAVSSEHAVGKAKAGFLKIMYGAEHIREMKAVKAALDPKGLLGRGNLFEEEGQG